MPTSSTLSLMRELAEVPKVFWPNLERFHSRNRLKVERAMAQIERVLDPPDLVEQMVDIIQQRSVRGTRNLLAMSNGSSGSHYLGELLNEFPGFHMTDEVYFPPDYIEQVRRSDDPDAWMALEFVDLLHTGRVDDGLTETTVVNIGHLRPDARPATLRESGYSPRFLLLLRNPFDIALERAFRKGAYRSEVDPDASDDDYLEKQASYTANFLSRAKREQWDLVLRYESLIGSPIAVLRDLSLALGRDWQLEEIERALEKYDPNRGPSGSISTNLNPKPREPVRPRHAEILNRTLTDIAGDFGYEPPERVAESLRKTHIPDLLLPLYAEESHYTEERFKAFQRGRIQVFRFQPETALVDDPGWEADPVQSKTWRLYYHSLSWLLALVWGVDHAPESGEAFGEMKRIVFSYLRGNVFSSPRDHMAWDDHATADRLTMISYLRAHYLDETLTDDEARELSEAVAIHIRRIESFYESGKWISSNHGLFHAVALLNASLTMPESEEANTARQIGERYLLDVIEHLVDPDDGVSLEQSVAYHSINLILVRQVAKFLRKNSIDGHQRLGHIAGLMVEFNLAIRGTNDARIAIGDTPFGDTIPKQVLRPDTGDATTRHVAHVLSEGRQGTAFPRLLVYPSVGWAVFRNGEIYEGTEPATRAFFTFSPQRGPHGHFDALSFSLQHAGWNVLIDSGGPYSYGDPMRFEYFVAPRAHNTVLLDDRDHQSGAHLVASGEMNGASYVIAHHDGYPEVRLARAVVHFFPHTFAVVDASSALDDVSKFSSLWHLAPDASVIEDSTKGFETFSIVGEDVKAILELSDAETRRSRIVTGSEDGPPVGWVTSAIDTKEQAPTIVSDMHTKQLFSVATVSIGEPRVGVTLEPSRCRLVGPDGSHISLEWRDDTLHVFDQEAHS